MNERFWNWTWEIQLPQAQTPRRFPGKPTGIQGVSGKGQLWARGTETRGGLFSQRHFLAAWGAPAHTSLMLGRTVMLLTPTCFPRLISHSVCRDEGMELALFSNRLPSPVPSFQTWYRKHGYRNPDSRHARKPGRQLHTISWRALLRSIVPDYNKKVFTQRCFIFAAVACSHLASEEPLLWAVNFQQCR